MSGILSWKWKEKALPLLSIGSSNMFRIGSRITYYSQQKNKYYTFFPDLLEEEEEDSFIFKFYSEINHTNARKSLSMDKCGSIRGGCNYEDVLMGRVHVFDLGLT
jgi:hypothetical protein